MGGWVPSTGSCEGGWGITLTLSEAAFLVGVVGHSLGRTRVLWFWRTDEETKKSRTD